MTTKFYTNVAQHGKSILVRGIDSTGTRFKKKIKYKPYLFIPIEGGTEYTNVSGDPVLRVDFDDIYEAREFYDVYSTPENSSVYGLERWPYLYIYDNYKNIVPDTTRLNVVGLDIEVLSDDGFPEPDKHEKPITAITMRRRNKRFVLGCHDYTPKDKNVAYIKCRDERDLLLKFIDTWEWLDPDVITGWYIEGFDIPYLYQRIIKVLSKKVADQMSPWGVVKERIVYGAGGTEITTFDLVGISNMDYQKVYKKFCLDPREKYSLDYIAELEINEKKLDYKTRGYKTLNEFYEGDFEGYIDYNIRDVDLIFKLEDYLGYLEQAYTLAYDAGVNFPDSLASVLIWDVMIHNHLRKKNIVVSPKNGDAESGYIEGGYVKEPLVGLHKWVVSFDLNSLYPHLIMQYNISPETRVSYNNHEYYNVDLLLSGNMDMSWLKKQNVTTTPNRMKYTLERHGFLPELMQKLYDDRTVYKKAMLKAKQEYENTKSKESKYAQKRNDNLQKATKIKLNSAYGALANKYFRWYDLHNAEAVTTSGQLSIRWIAKKLNEYLNKLFKTDKDYVIAIDTDSVYLAMDSLVQSVFDDDSDITKVVNFLDRVCEEQFEPYIEKCYQELAEYLNVYDQKMIMKRENIADKAIWTGKKRYIMNVWDNEGVRYNEAELKMMGIEAIRSSTPTVCRQMIKDSIKIIMNGTEQELQSFVKKSHGEFLTQPFEKIAFPRSVSFIGNRTDSSGSKNRYYYADPHTIYKKGTPAQVKGALLHNHLIEKKGLTNVYQTIKNGEKIKFAYLKEPNPLHDTVIAAIEELPEEFGLNDFVDYETQFEKSYLKPMSTILDVIGWQAEKRSTLEEFFT